MPPGSGSREENANPPALTRGDAIEVEVEKGVYQGLGIGRHQGQVVFVPRGLPGDRHRVRVLCRTAGYLRAVSEALVRGAPERRPSPCPLFARCGGCAYQELGYAAQLGLKAGVLRESLYRAGVGWDGEIEVRASPEEGWRTRAAFHLEVLPGGEVRLGLREEGRHRVVDVDRCLQLSPAMNRAFRAVLGALRKRPDWTRAVTGVTLAESVDGSRIVASLDTVLPAERTGGLAALMQAIPWLTGLGAVVGEGRPAFAVSSRRGRSRVRPGVGGRFVVLAGEPWIEDRILGFRLRSHVRSFFQVNRFLIEGLVREVLDLTPGGGTVLDLYAGVGLFTLPLAARCESARGVEGSATAVEDARINQGTAGADNVRFEEADVADALARWPVEPGERIVLDPPRSGAGPEVVAQIAARRPVTIVYVSCDPPTLGRDLRLFQTHGYRLDALRAFDLFPDTFHLETVVRLVPN